MRVTREQWEAKGRELFGDDQTTWRVVCPSCGREASIASTRADLSADELGIVRAAKWSLEQECIGRHLPDRGCDWAAYGLFAGPLFVDGVPVFDFAGKPFTGGES